MTEQITEGTGVQIPVPKEKKKKDTKPKAEGDNAELMSILGALGEGMKNINKRLDKIETGGANDFKGEVSEEDVKRASQSRERHGVDAKTCKIVDEVLGTDFGIEMEGYKDRPGFLFTVVVPPRLSELPISQRPVLDSDPEKQPGTYLKDKWGNIVLEDYQPADKRSRALSSSASYDSIKEYCELVRTFIVNSFNKKKKPLPAFKVAD